MAPDDEEIHKARAGGCDDLRIIADDGTIPPENDDVKDWMTGDMTCQLLEE